MSCLEGHFQRVLDAAPPFAPPRAVFACPALLTLASRASRGGVRESLLGAVMAVRLLSGLRPPFPLRIETRVARADGARSWLGALTIPAKTRAALIQAFQASSGEDPKSAADALEGVTEVTAVHLDRSARSELLRLVEALRSDAAELAAGREPPVE